MTKIHKIPNALPDGDSLNHVLVLYDRIVQIKCHEGKEGDTSLPEKELDSIICQIYGLNEDDIRMIDTTIFEGENKG